MTENRRIWMGNQTNSQQVPDRRISSYSARIRTYVPPLKSCESEESSRNVCGRIGDHFHVAKIEKRVKECIHDRISCSGTQNWSWEAGCTSDKFPTYTGRMTQGCGLRVGHPCGTRAWPSINPKTLESRMEPCPGSQKDIFSLSDISLDSPNFLSL